ncbi:MAG: DUF1232 domain-containing protein [Spirochaetaceae bacterium]|jgi:uncharacterized membrane protein YkvA (DUF1232 family)|nr:DUF1232 domain-containing protein [Spirochaetaceae bacterium]
MKWLKSLKEKAKELKSQLMVLYYAYKDPQTKLLPKILLLIALSYALSPIDLIPDFIPLFGYLDDLIILPVLIGLSIKFIPREIMLRSRQRAEEEPLTLKKNWVFAMLFILIWISLITLVLLKILD